jgi:hypothetical protein
MFGLFKKKNVKHSKDVAMPTPLEGRVGHVGGIESIFLDGVTYYFGYDYSNDLVISPLINKLDQMTHFATNYMTQRDGTHDEVYWREVAGYDSDLCSDIEGRTYLSDDLASMMARLSHAQTNDVEIPDFKMEYHLRYLLASAGGWHADIELDAEDRNIALIRGEEALPIGMRFSDVARNLQVSLGTLVSAAPGNWATLFSVLKT